MRAWADSSCACSRTFAFSAACRPASAAGSGRLLATAAGETAHAAHSVPMGYHEAFWVTLGTTAPVIGLAHLVALGRHRGLIARGEREIWMRMTNLTQELQAVSARRDRIREELDSARADSRTGQTLESADDRLSSLENDLKLTEAGLLAAEASQKRMPRHFPRASGLARAGEVLTGLSWAVCAATLALALLSLAWERDVQPPIAAAVLLLVATATLVCTGVLELIVRSRFRIEA
jgi:hypothetical protein